MHFFAFLPLHYLKCAKLVGTVQKYIMLGKDYSNIHSSYVFIALCLITEK
jgi:hypothetical protein